MIEPVIGIAADPMAATNRNRDHGMGGYDQLTQMGRMNRTQRR